MSSPLLACVGGPPNDWFNLEVLFNGSISADWIEVNVEKGRGTRYARDDEGEYIIKNNGLVHETVSGDFKLRYKGH